LKLGRQSLDFYQEYVEQVREKRKELKKVSDELAEGKASERELKDRKAPLENEYRKNIKTEKHFAELQSQICK
jgi:predicted  nucleic acid-binding Zn-ribbon protein